jgi:hypothetical protein
MLSEAKEARDAREARKARKRQERLERLERQEMQYLKKNGVVRVVFVDILGDGGLGQNLRQNLG